ncbi:50S ribosomal protein L22 [Patescibacteria group bacterium]|nr:50S ribosomal protein L22 [Patescibacteria group bacterium]
MTEVKAKLRNYKQSPRKVRLVADLVRGKKIERVISELKHVNKKVSVAMRKLIESAVANAKHNNKLNKDDLFLKTITVDEGPSMKRFKEGARGRAFPFKRRTSHITVTLEENPEEVKREVKKVVAVEKETKK